MRTFVKTTVIIVIVLLAVGLFAVFVRKARDAARLVECKNNLKQIGLALHGYHDTYKHFPAGTIPNANLPPEHRLSWMVEIWPAFMVGGVKTRIDRTKPWDTDDNCPPHCGIRDYSPSGEHRWDDRLVGDLASFICPANPSRTELAQPGPTHYIGIAGLGKAAAELPLAHPGAGFFGYDRKLKLQDLLAGSSNTLALVEVMVGVPWTAGGPATVRGVSDDTPDFGEGGQFGGMHSGGTLTNVLFADGSVRPLSATTSPEAFRSFVAIGGSRDTEP